MRNRTTTALLACVLSLCLVAPGSAGQFEDGVAAYRRGDYVTAARHWRPLAERGHAAAQYNLGVIYDLGKGMPQDFAQAAAWYLKAAKQGDANAQYQLGVLYRKGIGVSLDYAEAIKWYRKAAEQGEGKAQYNLGVLYFKGDGVPQDYVEAHKWFNLAAAQGDKNAAKAREYIGRKMSPTQITLAQRLAREWKPKK